MIRHQLLQYLKVVIHLSKRTEPTCSSHLGSLHVSVPLAAWQREFNAGTIMNISGYDNATVWLQREACQSRRNAFLGNTWCNLTDSQNVRRGTHTGAYPKAANSCNPSDCLTALCGMAIHTCRQTHCAFLSLPPCLSIAVSGDLGRAVRSGAVLSQLQPIREPHKHVDGQSSEQGVRQQLVRLARQLLCECASRESVLYATEFLVPYGIRLLARPNSKSSGLLCVQCHMNVYHQWQIISTAYCPSSSS